MSENRLSLALRREDIVGRRIKRVLCSAWDEDPDGFAACLVYVELTGGVLFELQGVDFGDVETIWRLDARKLDLRLPDRWISKECVGVRVREVVASEFWHTIGLLLEDDKLLIVSEDCSPKRVGPCVHRIGEAYTYEDFVEYWSRRHVSRQGDGSAIKS